MASNKIIAEGKTTNEAIENGLKILKVSKNMVNIKVLENDDKKSFFSILAPRVVKIEMSLKDDIEKRNNNDINTTSKETLKVSKEILELAEKNTREFLDAFLKDFSGSFSYQILRDEYGLKITFDGEDAGYFIGYRGETLYAMQTLISYIACKNIDEKMRISLNIENYKEKREETLKNLALKISKTVEKTKKAITLEPMQAYERKIIHSCLQESSTVKTYSIGEEPRRRVVISLK